MSRKSLTTLMAALVVATLGSAALVAPASAGGQVSVTYTPQNAKQATALKTGLAAYSLINGAKNGNITQQGLANMAGIFQSGQGNVGVLGQYGNGHTGTINQTGDNNSCGLFQFGKGTTGNCTQTGGETSATVQVGF